MTKAGAAHGRPASGRARWVGGYSFGDRPVNRELAHYLAKSKDQRLLVWTPRPHLRQILARLQVQLDAERTVLAADQIETEAIVLPDTAAVDRVIERFRPA